MHECQGASVIKCSEQHMAKDWGSTGAYLTVHHEEELTAPRISEVDMRCPVLDAVLPASFYRKDDSHPGHSVVSLHA